MLPKVAIVFVTLAQICLAQLTCDGTETFEKISGVNISSARLTPLYSEAGGTVTAQCNNRCRASQDCPSFLLDYDKSACFRLDINTEDSRDIIVPTDTRSAYYEKICLRSPACEKAWIFERAVGYLLQGYDDRIIQGVVGRIDCQELCLIETEFPCASADYDYSTRECKLSRESRRTQPGAYRATTGDIDYIENQCVVEEVDTGCKYEVYEGQDIGYADIKVQAGSAKECGLQCDQTSAFNCRSFTFEESSSVCRLSGEDNISAGPGAVQARAGADYYQRGPCLELSLECSADSMTVTLNTEEPFSGRLYSQPAGKDCETRGNARTETQLTLDFDDASQARCGITREEEGVLSAVVVVQHHPVLQRKGDKAVQLLCFFAAQDKVVTNSYDVLADTVDGGFGITSPSSIVNATASSPGVRLRIVTASGEDISGTRLGEKLFLRIEMEQGALFGIFARNLRAISGDNVDSIQLLDERGCPTDPLIFSGLSKIDGSQDLQGTFEAFKFSESSVVRFQVSVQFCVGDCQPVNCDDGKESFGRRKRSVVTLAPSQDFSIATLPTMEGEDGEAMASHLVYDDRIGQEIIDGDSELSKEIYVESGTTVDKIRDPYGGLGEGRSIETLGGEMVCTTMTVLVAASVGVVLLQVSILTTCLLCLYFSRSGKQAASSEVSTRTSLPSYRTSTPVYHDNFAYRPSSRQSRATEYSDKTLQSLRTSLRD